MASKAYTISMPEDLMQTVDGLAAREHRTRSGLIQEAVRQYGREVYPVSNWLAALYDAYAPARAEIAALGLTEDEIGRIID